MTGIRDALRPDRLWRARRRRHIPRRLSGPRLLRKFADAYPEAMFVEIGAYDGEPHDRSGPVIGPFIASRAWTGVMVEPVPYVFARLRRKYGGLDRVVLVNAAIADADRRVPFYHLPPVDGAAREDLPDWYDEIGSLSRDSLLAWEDAIPDIARRIVCTEVPALTFESLCRKHDLRELDLLLIDAEGYDYEIIKRVDFRAHRPRLVVYEHAHLAAAERRECRAHMEELGFETMEEAFNTWCLDTRVDDAVTRAWRRLRPRFPGISAEDLRRLAASRDA